MFLLLTSDLLCSTNRLPQEEEVTTAPTFYSLLFIVLNLMFVFILAEFLCGRLLPREAPPLDLFYLALLLSDGRRCRRQRRLLVRWLQVQVFKLI